MYKKNQLIQLLRKAYSGELAAALAYRGHWNSLSGHEDRERIKQIEFEEWMHRKLVGKILQSFRTPPDPVREVKGFLLGRLLGFGCGLLGWFAPMYLAGFLESKNIVEYTDAAQLAVECGHPEILECLYEMAKTEWQHEQFFRSKVLSHRFSRWIPIWPVPEEFTTENTESTELTQSAPL
jgi:demethoxyubiquinone hydroxylase (CLK1/Coq7/Cat5 family)